MEEFKSCENCYYLDFEQLKEKCPEKIYCKKRKFIKVSKSEFFYDPYVNEPQIAVYLNKYESFSHSINCEYYKPYSYMRVTDVGFVKNSKQRYEDIVVVIEIFEEKREVMIKYSNISPGAAIRKHFEKVQRWIYANISDGKQ